MGKAMATNIRGDGNPCNTPAAHLQADMLKHQFHSELQFQMFPEFIWWQGTRHWAALSLMQACGLVLLLDRNSVLCS